MRSKYYRSVPVSRGAAFSKIIIHDVPKGKVMIAKNSSMFKQTALLAILWAVNTQTPETVTPTSLVEQVEAWAHVLAYIGSSLVSIILLYKNRLTVSDLVTLISKKNDKKTPDTDGL